MAENTTLARDIFHLGISSPLLSSPAQCNPKLHHFIPSSPHLPQHLTPTPFTTMMSFYSHNNGARSITYRARTGLPLSSSPPISVSPISKPEVTQNIPSLAEGGPHTPEHQLLTPPASSRVLRILPVPRPPSPHVPTTLEEIRDTIAAFIISGHTRQLSTLDPSHRRSLVRIP